MRYHFRNIIIAPVQAFIMAYQIATKIKIYNSSKFVFLYAHLLKMLDTKCIMFIRLKT